MVRKRCPTQPPGHLLIYFSQKAVTVQGGHGAVFAVWMQFLWALRVSRYKVDK
jgi:hypothetical protein